MSAFGLDPEQMFRRRPRVVRNRPPSKLRRILLIVAGVIVVLVIIAGSLMRLRVNYLFLSSLGHSNVFWTPLITQVILFIAGFVITGGLVGVSVPFWSRALKCIDARTGRWGFWVGVAVAVLAAIGGGAHLAGDWQDVLLWLHGHPFGASDPVFHMDYGFFVFTLPVIDSVSALLWGAAIVGFLGAAGVVALALVIIQAPDEIDIPLKPEAGRTTQDGLRIALLHTGGAMAAIFVLAALGAHFGAYHLATSPHPEYSFTGPDATELNVTRPVLGALQVIALVFAAGTIALLWLRIRQKPGMSAVYILGGVLGGWLVLAAAIQTIPAAVYTAVSVNPNAQSAQAQSITNYLNASRYAWGLGTAGDTPDVVSQSFGTVGPPALDTLQNDSTTLNNVRIVDTSQLPDVLDQIDRSRSYQSYTGITVDRYPDANGQETEVMIGAREISESNIPNDNFVNQTFVYTHGYGITAVSVNQVAAEGKPNILVGKQPLTQVDPNAPPDLNLSASGGSADIYCGEETTQPVVVNTKVPEFDYPATPDQYNHAGTGMAGFTINNPFDKLATSVTEFGGLNLFLSDETTSQSEVLMHRTIADRIETVAPFLTVDGDPYIVSDPEAGALMWIADAYVETGNFPESDNVNGISYQRNAVKAVVNARTCAVSLYAVDLNEPLTAAWNAIYPGLLQPLSQMPSSLVQHLRYPQDLFTNQAKVYAQVHVTSAAGFFTRNDFYSLSQQLDSGGNTVTTSPQYVELTLPGTSEAQFVLLQTFSPYQSGSGGTANNMTAWLAAESDYTTTNHPQLVAVPLKNNTNVLGPLQFDNNSNTDPTISQEKTLLSQSGSSVYLGSVIVLPFNDDSFLYVRPFYVSAQSSNGSSFPQLRYVIVGTQNSVAFGTSLPAALQALFDTTSPIPGLTLPSTTTTPTPTPSPGASPTPSPSAGGTPTATPATALTAQELAVLADLVQQESNLESAYASGNLAAAGAAQQAINADIAELDTLLKAGGVTIPTPTAAPTPTPSLGA
ncbi:MAG: UPF0182 family protein [Candidatus Dormibacteria bacterium]|jgi:uncharacterized membrane protein (UPF0182 family)